MFGLTSEEKTNEITNYLAEMSRYQQDKNSKIDFEFARIRQELSSTQNNFNVLIEDIKLQNARLDKQDIKLEDFRKIIVQMGKVVNALAIEKKIVEAPKPKEPEEELKESIAQLTEDKTEDKEEPLVFYCLVCNKETETTGVTISQTNMGKMYIGKCAECGSPKNKKA